MPLLNALDVSLGEVAITTGDRSASCYVRDIKTGSVLAVFDVGLCKTHCLSLIGENYVINSVRDTRTLNIWKLAKHPGELVSRIECPGEVSALAVSFAGTHCVGAIGSKLYVWKVANGNLLGVLDEHTKEVTCLKFSSDGEYFVSGGKDTYVIAWSLSQIVIKAKIKHQERLDDQEKMIFEKDQNYMHLWSDNLDDVTDIHVGHFGEQARVAVASYDQKCYIYELKSGDRLFTILMESPLHSVVMDPAEYFLFLGAENGSIYVLDSDVWFAKENPGATMKPENILSKHRCEVTSLSVSVDGQFLLSGSKDSTTIIWNVFSRTPLHIFDHSGSVTNAFISYLPCVLSNEEEMLPEINFKPLQFTFTDFKTQIWKLKLKCNKISSLNEDEDNTFNKIFLRENEEITPFTEVQESYKTLSTVRETNKGLNAFCVDTVLSAFDTLI